MSGNRGFKPKCVVCKKFVTKSSSEPVLGSSDRKHRAGDPRCTTVASLLTAKDEVPMSLGQMASAFGKLLSQ